jgi:outer membrane protein OmpA-like peptidoglycan-associated protein
VCCIRVGTYAQYIVQLAAYERPVDEKSYFEGLDENIYHVRDRHDIHRYYIPGLSEEDAKVKAEEMKKKGFRAQAIDMERIKKLCNIECGTPTPAAMIPADKIDIKTLQWVFFDFDKADIRTSSCAELDKLVTIMKAYPTYKVEFAGHADSKGTDDYNFTLSEIRANKAKNYLQTRNIGLSRIQVNMYGELRPIARNEVNGRDTELGRQFNRRVEIKIFDAGGSQVNLVETPNIPLALR